jgi:ABC-type branched-subunit amino acid transport system substrate-binding protein
MIAAHARSRVLRSLRPGCAALLLAGAAALPAAARDFPVGLLTMESDARYAAQTLEKGYADAPSGRSAAAARLALEDSSFALRAAGYTAGRLVTAPAADAAGLAAAFDSLLRQGVRHIVLELPAAGVAQVAAAARGKDVLLVNAAAPEDALRGGQCAPQLLHALPSHAMQADAIAQLLVARKWNRPLVLHGDSAADGLLLAAFVRSARRFGLKPVAQRSFKLSADPRERELGNVRLLTASADYDAVVVLDAAGLTAQAWSPWYEHDGAVQLNRRFRKAAGRAMGSYDWATWLGTRALVEAAALHPSAVAAQLKSLKDGTVALDGYKGQGLTFRPWDGQLRQPLLLAHGNAVAEAAPLEGFLHPRSTLDTLGYDAAETGCKPR